MSALTDLAVSAIIKAIEDEPKCAAKLHAAVMLYGKDHLEKSFNESEPFVNWRETQRTIGRVEELLFITKRLSNMVDRYSQIATEAYSKKDLTAGHLNAKLAEEFNHLADKLMARIEKFMEPLRQKGVEVPGFKKEAN